MTKEIERKFLVTDDGWRERATASTLRQGYLSTSARATVRVRLVDGRAAYLTIKGEKAGPTRSEYEYAIPVADAEEMLAGLCEHATIEKTRYTVTHQGLTWVVDVFEGANAGLVVAEVELEHEDQKIALPGWVGEEVTDDLRYLNANLITRPFSQW